MKQIYVIYTFIRNRTKTIMRMPKTFKHKSDPNIFNTLIEQLEILGVENEEEWVGSYKFVTKEFFESFLENEYDIEITN